MDDNISKQILIRLQPKSSAIWLECYSFERITKRRFSAFHIIFLLSFFYILCGNNLPYCSESAERAKNNHIHEFVSLLCFSDKCKLSMFLIWQVLCVYILFSLHFTQDRLCGWRVLFNRPKNILFCF